jgi:hypothetical protein
MVELTPPPLNHHVFLVKFFFNLAILVGKKMKKKMQIQGKMQTTKNLPKIWD